MAQGVSIHIGLNAVNPACYDGVWDGKLDGAEQDAKDMYAIAQQQGFQSVKLLAEAATRDAVITAIGEASEALVAGDFLLVTYGGHGGMLPDISGDECDGVDETWCLYDGHLLDDELGAWWGYFAAGVRILVVSDSCHSGTVTRGAAGKPRAMPRRAALGTWQQHRDFYTCLIANAPQDKPLQASVRLLAASTEGELAYDGVYDGLPNGFFTKCLKQVWAKGAFVGDYDAFFAALYDVMYLYQPPEHSVIGVRDPEYDRLKPFQI
ncbi:caspase family protein [Thiothrix lacustris]|uniref:caspase family protein n=1 Tax=Thiothrix lacustris TaxID=525917 RepID=UPI0027E55EC8|nr:caspase family protein [Thiothrix lacustris]WMP17024.1 caspase family protein [Thiothrix lacustris]